jgi:hypothetical protein
MKVSKMYCTVESIISVLKFYMQVMQNTATVKVEHL